MPRRVFVTGTDTNVGKTVLSALLCAAMDSFYWKPIQTGACDGTDRNTVLQLSQISPEKCLPESYCFDPPVSPHLAAQQAGKEIELAKICVPRIPDSAALVVEGAGGVMVPITPTRLMTALIRQLNLPVLVASRSTLGTINHIGSENTDNQRAIEKYGDVPVVGMIPWLESLSRDSLLEVYRTKFDPQVFIA